MSSWMIASDKLDAEQKHFIFEESKNKENIWIKGFAGSGKSILLVHSIVEKIRENPDVSICVVVFTHSLIQMFTVGMEELKIPYKNVVLLTYYKFMDNKITYDYIFCDEVQDLPISVLENMKTRTGQLILAGDSNQSIYERTPSGELTVTQLEIKNITNSKPYELTTIHRLTKSIINIISNLLPEMNIFKAKTDRMKQDISVRLGYANDKNQEVEYILSQANEAISIGESVVIILPEHEDIINFVNLSLCIKNTKPWEKIENKWGKPHWSYLNRYLSLKKINIEYIGNGYGDLYNTVRLGKLAIMTYHSAKGLDFDNVFLPFLSKEINLRNKTIFMVGMTRSKKDLYLTYSGSMHKYVESFENGCTKIDIDAITNNNIDDLSFDF
jgi:hypothetical protein